MTPDEGLQHEWILEGNFNKVRPRARPAVKTDSSPSRDNSNELSFHKQTSKKHGKTEGCSHSWNRYTHNCTFGEILKLSLSLCGKTVLERQLTPRLVSADEGVGTDSSSSDKLQRDDSVAETKMAPAERLRPIGASAEEEVCENHGKLSSDTKQQEGGGGERPVHIIIKPQEDSPDSKDD